MAKLRFNSNEYIDLKNFVALFVQRFYYDAGKPTNGDIITMLSDMERKSSVRAAVSLMLMVNDSIEKSSDWDGDKIRAFDDELRKNGITTLTELRRQYSKQYVRILKRGKINSEEDYYLLKGMLDGNFDELSVEEVTQLTEMLDVYEKKIMKQLGKQS